MCPSLCPCQCSPSPGPEAVSEETCISMENRCVGIERIQLREKEISSSYIRFSMLFCFGCIVADTILFLSCNCSRVCMM